MDISKHREIINPNNNIYPIHIIGCGATGSWLSTILAKIGFTNIHLYDFDIVEEHNLANQNYTLKDIGKSKVESLENILKEYNPDIDIIVHNEEVDKDSKLNGIVFMLTDTMESRKEIYENCIKNNQSVKLLIETRMGSDQCMIYTIQPCRYGQQNYYEKTFYGDDVAEVSFCGTTLSIITTALSTSAQAVWQLINFLNNEEDIQNEIIINYKDINSFKQKFNNF